MSKQAFVAHLVDAAGRQCGRLVSSSSESLASNTPPGYLAILQPPPGEWHYWSAESLSWIDPGGPPSEHHTFDFSAYQWRDQRDVEQSRVHALEAVDQAAGSARLRYITSVPGQAETYTRKESQAREWEALSFAGPPPSFIAAEAEALGRPPQSVAEEVISLADQWSNVIGPAIEAARRKWKVAIEGATTVEAIEAARASAIAELAGL